MRVVLVALTLVAGAVSCESQPMESGQAGPSTRSSWVLQGYQQSATSVGVDSVGGRLWKDGGPDISYEISPSSGEHARVFALDNAKASLTVVASQKTGEIAVALDEEKAEMVISVDKRVHFHARNVRTRKDAVEAVLLASAAAGSVKW